MISLIELFHYSVIALTVAIPALSVSLGQGLIGRSALKASDIQPDAKPDILKAAVFGSALSETSALIGLVMSLFLLLGAPQEHALTTSIAQMGIALAICLPGCVIGIVSAWPTQEACLSIARQPFFHEKIVRLMLLIQSIIQTPVIFGFIIAMFIKNQAFASNAIVDGIRLACSGLCLGLGSIGPAIGLALFGRAACKGVGINRTAYTPLVGFTLISEAIIETPIVFALIIALILAIVGNTHWSPIIAGTSMISAALCMGLGTLGPGISSGSIASTACQAITHTPEQYQSLSRLSMLAQGIVDTSAIYAFTIAMLLLFIS